MRTWLCLSLLTVSLTSAAPRSDSLDPENRSRLIKAYSGLPLSFEENRGQTDHRVKFLSHGSGFGLFLTPENAVLALPIATGSSVSMRMSLVGGNVLAKIVGIDKMPGKSNYLIGNKPEKWLTGVPTFAKVKYEDVYPGVDLLYYGNQGELEYDFVVAPHADPRKIELEVAVDSAEGPRIDSNGDVLLKFGGGELRFRKPMVYQLSGERRTAINGRFVLRAGNRVGFEVAAYDPTRPLVIDPAITYSTYLGGTTGGTVANAIATYTDPGTGHVYGYITGSTSASDFPTVNARQPVYGGGSDAFVTKFDPSAAGAASVIYSTFLGGSNGDNPTGIAVDSAGQVYITGQTSSSDFPTMHAYQTSVKFGPLDPQACPITCVGAQDAFVAKLSADGHNLMYSTYFGGSGIDGANAIALDSTGRVYVAGSTFSSDLPTQNPYQSTLRGRENAFVVILDTTLMGSASLSYSTYLGSATFDFPVQAFAIAADSSGTFHVGGSMSATDFPIINGFQTTPGGGFYARLNPAATGAAQLVYSTYLSSPSGLALDTSGNVYLSSGGGAIKINPSQLGSSSLIYATTLADSPSSIAGIAVDAGGNAFVVGTSGPGLPLVNPVQGSNNGVFQSADAGATWAVLRNGLSDFLVASTGNPNPAIDALAIDASTSPRTVYAGIGPYVAFGNVTDGTIVQSTDGGLTWKRILQLQNGGVLALTVDPASPSNVYAGTIAGVFKSSDRGATWSAWNSGLTSTAAQSVTALVFDSGTLYAGAQDGLYKLSSGASIWTSTALNSQVYRIAVDPTTNPHALYTLSMDGLSAYKSIDGGTTWASILGQHDSYYSPFSISALAVDTNSNPATLYGFEYGCGSLVKSTSGSANWITVPDPSAISCSNNQDNTGNVAIDATHIPSIVYAYQFLDLGGLYKTVDGGSTWTLIASIQDPVLAVDSTTATSSVPATLYATTFQPHADAFVVELSPTGSTLLFSTYIGGAFNDTLGNGIALDNAGNIYVTGRTTSSQFPAVNAYQPLKPAPLPNTDRNIAFFTKLGNQSLPPSSPSSVATQVGVQTGTLTVTLPNITGSTTNTPPTLTVAPLSSASTANFSLSNNLGAYDISTTATFAASTSNPVTLCFQATTVNDLSTFSGLEIMHVVNGVPQNVTTSYDFPSRTICGAVTSLSPFVLVKGPVGQLNDLVRMVTESDVKHGIQTSLDAKLQAASSALSDAKKNAGATACNVLAAFMSDVQAQTGKNITQQEANAFINAARQVKATIGCTQ